MQGSPAKMRAERAAGGSPKTHGSPAGTRSTARPAGRSPGGRSMYARNRPAAASGLRFLPSEPMPPSRTPVPPARGPGGMALGGAKPIDNGHSFILESHTRGLVPDELPEGSVHGVNPVLKWQVDLLRKQRQTSRTELGTAKQLQGAAAIETHDSMQRLVDDWEYSQQQTELLRTSLQNASVELRSAREFSNIHRQHIEDLRAESRELSMKEAELDLATSALPWAKQLPPDLPPCTLCMPYRVTVALCRVVRGHRNDLPEGPVLDAVFFLHNNFTENAASRSRGKLAYVPFAQKLEAFSDDPDVNSLLAPRCCRNDRGSPLEMATSYPWLTTMSTATEKDDLALKDTLGPTPEADLELQHVYSYSGDCSKQNLLHLHTGALLFNAGAICVVHDLASKTQKFFRHHTEFVSAFAMFPHEAENLVASAQDGANPRICIWNTVTMRLISMLEGSDTNKGALLAGARVFPSYLEAGVRSISFSRDGRQLIALADDTDCSIVIHECTSRSTESKWTSSKCVASAKAAGTPGEKALNATFSPFSNTILTAGVKHMKFWEVHPRGEMLARAGIFGTEDTNEIHLSVAYLDAETCVTGTATGMIWIWKGVRVMQVIAWAHEGPIFDLAVDGRMLVSSGQDMKVCFWNLQKDFRIVPPGKIERGEMLVKQLNIADTVRRGNSESTDRWLERIGVGCVKALAWNSHRVFVGTGFNHIFVVDDIQHTATLIISGHHRGGMTGVCSHPKLPLVLSVGREGTILVRNSVTKETMLARNLEVDRGTRKVAKSVDVSVSKHKTKVVKLKKSEKQEVRSGGGTEELLLQDKEDDEEEEDSENEDDVPEHRKKKEPDWPVQLTCIDVCVHGAHVAVGQGDGGFTVLSLEYDAQGELTFDNLFAVIPKKPKEDSVTSIKISPSVGFIAVGFSRGYVKVYQTANLQKKNPSYVVCRGLYAEVTHLDWDDKSRCIRVNDSFNDLKVFDVRSGSEIDYFGSLFSVKLKRLRFCPEYQRSSEREKVDFEKYPEAKVVGFGLTRHRPYLVQCLSSLVDAEGIPEFAAGYSNEPIQIGDRLIEVGGMPVETLGFDSLRQLLYGLPCKPECDPHHCAHSLVEIVFTRNRQSNLNVGPGTGAKIYTQDQINVSQCGPYHLEGRWTSSSCPLTWASHRLYLDKYIPGEVLSTASSARQKLMAIGDTYGQVTVMGYPADVDALVNKDGQQTFCAIDHICFTDKDRHLFVGNKIRSMLMQWKPVLVTEAKRAASPKALKLPARTQDGITNLHLRLLLDRPFASESTDQKVSRRKPVAEDGFDAQKQWWQNAVPDSEQREGNDFAPCDRELVLDHVYGYNGREGRHNVFELMNGDLLFPVGCLCALSRPVGSSSQISDSPTEITQYFFRGHTDFVTALAVHPNGRIIASGDCGLRPLICIWDVESPDWINRSLSICLASIRGFHKNGISALAFSSDGEHLASVGEDSSNAIAVFEWQKDSLLPYAVCPSGQNRVLCCAFNPYAFEIVTCGVKHVSFWAFEPNSGAEIERHIAMESVKQYKTKDKKDVWLEVLLDRDPTSVAKMCPARVVNRSLGLSDQFMEWAIHDQECSDSYIAAKSLGESYVASTNVCAVYIDRDTAVTGAADGKILVWTNNKLTSFVDAHNGPIFDIDCPKNRGSFRGDMMISNVKNEKHFVRVEVRGAATDDVMNRVAKEALEEWHKEFKRTRVQKRDPPQLKNALIRWEASDAQEFVTCGEDGTVKLWGMRQMLVVGHSTYDLTELFEKFCTGFRGGHKFRSKTITYEEFISCLAHLQLLHETEHMNDGDHAYETIKGSDHMRLSKAEAKRIFRDQNVPEMHYGDFASCIERIFNLLGVRAEADHMQMVNLREELNQDLVRLVVGQQDDPNGAYADTFDYRILKTKEDIQRIDVLLRKGRISMYRSLQSLRAVRLERPDMNDLNPGVDCLRSIYLKSGKIIVGTSSNSIHVFSMQTGKWKSQISGHDGSQISSICTCPTNVDVMVSGGQDADLILWSRKARAVQDRRKFPAIVEAVDFSPSSRDTLAVGLSSGDIFILDVSQGSLMQHVAEVHVSDSVSVVRFSPDGRWIAVGSHSGTIRLFEICYDSVEKQGRFRLKEHPSVFYGHQGPVASIDWSADSKLIQSASQLGGELIYWSIHDGQQIRGLTVSDIKNLKWFSFTSIFGWHMHGPHKHISRQVKLVNKDVEPLIGQRVRRASAVLSSQSEVAHQVGTVIRISRDKRCDVRWDTNMVEGNVGVGNHKNQKIDIGYGGSPKYDLVLAENSTDIREIASTDACKVVDKYHAAFIATGDNGGFVQLLPLTPAPTTAVPEAVHQQHAHPGGTHLVRISGNDKLIYTTGRLDHSIFQWICRPREDMFLSIADILRKCASTGVREFFGGLALLADDLFPERTVTSIRKIHRVKEILDEIKEGLSFGPRDVVGLTICLEDEGESVPKGPSDEARKEKAIRHDISEAVGILRSRIEFCGWERASNDPADPKYRLSHVYLNLSAAEFEGFGKISSAELFADQIIEQIRDPKSKIRNSMTTRLAVRGLKQRAFEMIPPPPPAPANQKKGRTVRACEYPGCEGAVVEIDETRAKIKPAGDLGFQVSRTAGFDFRFRRLRSRIFDPIIRTSVTNVNALQPSKAPKPLYRAEKPDLTHQQLVTIFQILDYGDRGWISHADFMAGLRRNPDFAGLLGVPTIDLQKVASRHIYERRYGDEGLDSSGIDASKKMDMEEFVSFFGKIQKQIKPLESIENATWTISTNAMKTPSLCDAILSIKGCKPPTRRWNHKITSHSVLPVLEKQEALDIFNELGLGKNDSITQADFVKLLQRSPHLEEKLGRKKIKAEELAAFFSDIGIWNPYVEKAVKKQTVPIGVAFQAFQSLDEEGQGWLMIGSFVTGLKQYPAIADSLGLLSRSMRHDALAQIYEYIYRTKPVIASRKIDLAEFIQVFSNFDLGDMGLAVPYRPPKRPKIVPLSVPFRIFQQYFSRKEHSVPYKDFVAGLKRYPEAADSLGLMSWVKESNASLQIFQLLFGVEEFDEEKEVTMGDLFRTFSGHEIEDLAVDLPYEREAAHERPPLISAKLAIAAFHQAGGSKSAFITHGELVDAMKNDLELAKTLGFLKPIKEEDGTHTIARIMHGTKRANDAKKIEFDDFFTFFTGQKIETYGMTLPHKEAVQKKNLDLIELPVALELWERLDEYERGYITHRDFWGKLGENPDIAEKLGSKGLWLKMLSEPDGSTQIYSLMNPGQRQVNDFQKYQRAFWIEFFTGQNLGKQEKALRKWKELIRDVAGLPRWRKLIVRLQLENASLTCVRGILRCKQATVKAAKLALDFLDAIQSPRLAMNDGDDLRVMEVMACVAYVATYKGPLRMSQLDLCVSHTVLEHRKRQNAASNSGE